MTPLIFWLLSLSNALKFDCKKLGVEFLDQSVTVENSTADGELRAVYSPCVPIKDEGECEGNMCLIQKVNGSDPVFLSMDNPSIGLYLPPHYDKPYYDDPNPFLTLSYFAEETGNSKPVWARSSYYCTEKEQPPYLSTETDSPTITFSGPNYCNFAMLDSRMHDQPGILGSLFGFIWKLFKWAFIVFLVAFVLFGVSTVLSRYLPEGLGGIREILADLPYLAREVLRKITGFFTGSNSNYNSV